MNESAQLEKRTDLSCMAATEAEMKAEDDTAEVAPTAVAELERNGLFSTAVDENNNDGAGEQYDSALFTRHLHQQEENDHLSQPLPTDDLRMMPYGRGNLETVPQQKSSKHLRPLPKPASNVRKASLEIPIRLGGDAEDIVGGGVRLDKNLRLAVMTSFQLKRSLRGSISCTSTMRGRTGYSKGQADVNYKIGNVGSVRGGFTFGESSPEVYTGLSIGKANRANDNNFAYNLTANVSTNPFNSGASRSTATLTGSRTFGLLTIRTSCALHSSSIKMPSLMFNIVSRSYHKWQLGLGWNPHHRRPLVTVAACPRRLFSDDKRQVDLTAQWRGHDGWQLGATITQSLQSVATKIGVGFTHLSAKGVAWIFSWTKGDLTLRVPIVVSPAFAQVWAPLHVAYVSMMSHIIHDIIAVIWQTKNVEKEKQRLAEHQERLKRQKGRNDALIQQRLMERQARTRTAQELKLRNGLVIKQALYHIDGSDADPFDVTIPLQFWVSQSSLTLPPSKKKNLLGFYDVSNDVPVPSDNGSANLGSSSNNSISISSWCSGFWTGLETEKTDSQSKTPQAVPRLTIKYEVSRQNYEITIQDHEELTLPTQCSPS